MEVTRKNFEIIISELPDVFAKAQFLAIDTEFTGLRVDGAAGGNYFDTLEQLYLKDRLKAETFMIIQYGIVAFIYNNTTKKYTHKAYNFYIYPSTYSDINFTCQSKSIEFLIENGFDFNKLFRDGIPYLRDSEIEKLIEKLEQKQEFIQNFENNVKLGTPAELAPAINAIIQKIEENLNNNCKLSFKTEKYFSFTRKHIYGAVRKKFGNQIFMETNKDETMTIHVGYSACEIKEMQKANFVKEKNKVLDEAGFSKVIKLIIDSKKLIIGHNLFLDLLFTIRQFLTSLPDNYNEFKELVTFLFSNILDTKFMAANSEIQGLKDTSLCSLMDYFEKCGGFSEIEDNEIDRFNIGYRISDYKHHEAAYDAYLTGLTFLAMCKLTGGANIFENLPESSIVYSMLNKFSIRKLCDIPFMNIGGDDIIPDRSNVYHLTFPKDWKRENISELFKACGFIYISWINSTSAFIQFKSENLKEVEKLKLGSNNQNYKLCSYEEFQNENSSMKKIDSSLNSSMEKKFDLNAKSTINNVAVGGKRTLKDSFSKKRQIEDLGEVIERPQKIKIMSE